MTRNIFAKRAGPSLVALTVACAPAPTPAPQPADTTQATSPLPAPAALELELRPAWQARIESLGYQGAFVALDEPSGRWIASDAAWMDRSFVPASTFKILNSLIALELGVADSAEFTLPWDGVERWSKAWNQDQTLRSAFAVSALWYYQEIARRVGAARMANLVARAGYGNQDISGGIDVFWLNGGLRISPREQIEFVQRLHRGQTPFSESTRRVFLDEVMVYAHDDERIIRAKTGWAKSEDFADAAAANFQGNLGWFVGSVEREGELVYFAMVLTAPEPTPPSFGEDRKALAFAFLGELGWGLPPSP